MPSLRSCLKNPVPFPRKRESILPGNLVAILTIDSRFRGNDNASGTLGAQLGDFLADFQLQGGQSLDEVREETGHLFARGVIVDD